MLKRVHFHSSPLPYLLVAPQIIITLIFFIWPAGQALYQSLLIEDAFGLSREFVWFENFEGLFQDEQYLGTVWRTIFFSVFVAGLSMGFALLLAGFADRVWRGALAYRTMLIWPYAVAPVLAGASGRRLGAAEAAAWDLRGRRQSRAGAARCARGHHEHRRRVARGDSVGARRLPPPDGPGVGHALPARGLAPRHPAGPLAPQVPHGRADAAGAERAPRLGGARGGRVALAGGARGRGLQAEHLACGVRYLLLMRALSSRYKSVFSECEIVTFIL